MKRSVHASTSGSTGARELRTRQTPAEELLWRAIRGRQINGLKFRRQHPIGPFVVDFCCPERRLAIELDGGVHDSQQDYDAERDRWLQAAGYRVLRFPNDAVMHNISSVLDRILSATTTHHPR
jgi:very-short-patch-repair endonuclease